MQSSVCNYSTVSYEVKQHVAYLSLNRPDKGNALNEKMIAELSDVFHQVQEDTSLRALCINGLGKHFCTGADLNDMQASVDYSLAKNTLEATKLAQMMQALHDLEVPVIAAVNGAAYGGAIGLLANCDIVIAEKNAAFCLSEVKLGLVPAVISPYVIEALGMQQAKYLMLSAQKIYAQRALEIGLVHQVVDSGSLQDSLQNYVDNLLKNGPQALRHVKKLCRTLPTLQDLAERQQMTAHLIARVRISSEAQTRMRDFFEQKNV